MLSIEERKQDVIKRFKHFESWEDRYRQLIHYGKKLPPMPDAIKTEDRLIPGCVSRVWLYHECQDERIFFQGDSDAIMTKGIIGIFLYVYSQATPKEIAETPPSFMSETGLQEHLSVNRRNGLASMGRVIQLIGQKYLSP